MAEQKPTEAAAAKATEKAPEKKPAKPKGSKPSFKSFGNYFKSVYAEISKIVWPTRKQVLNNTLAVILAILIVGAFIWGIDALFSWPVNLMTKLR